MTHSTLLAIQKQIRSFKKVIDSLVVVFGDSFSHYITISVILHNMSHNTLNCLGYNHLDKVAELHNYSAVLREIAIYHNSHIETYIHTEIDMIIDGLLMCEDIN